MTITGIKKTAARSSCFSRLISFLITVGMFISATAGATGPDGYRVAYAGSKFDSTVLGAGYFHVRTPRVLRAHRVELVLGALVAGEKTRPFVSLGPVWRHRLGQGTAFIEFGISPTLVTASSFNGRAIGGSFHFTSSLALGMSLDSAGRTSVSARIQHMSNGGLNSVNPGMDMIGINFTIGHRDQ